MAAAPHPCDAASELPGAPGLTELPGAGTDASPDPAFVAALHPRAAARKEVSVMRGDKEAAVKAFRSKYGAAGGVTTLYVTKWRKNDNPPGHVAPAWSCAGVTELPVVTAKAAKRAMASRRARAKRRIPAKTKATGAPAGKRDPQ